MTIAVTYVPLPLYRFILMPLVFAFCVQVVPVSQSQADQRAGRAGREVSGKCFRLYQERTYEALAPSSTPEIMRTNLSQTLLLLLGLGIDDVDPLTFPYPTHPGHDAVKRGLVLLKSLGALTFESQSPNPVPSSLSSGEEKKAKKAQLTVLGRKMAVLPLEPQLSLLLLKSIEFGCAFKNAIFCCHMLT